MYKLQAKIIIRNLKALNVKEKLYLNLTVLTHNYADLSNALNYMKNINLNQSNPVTIAWGSLT